MLNRQIVSMVGAIVAAAWLAGARPALAVDTATRLEVATRLTAEAESYIERDDYTRAEPLLQAALIVAETAVGPTDARIIRNLNMLAELLSRRTPARGRGAAPPALARHPGGDARSAGPDDLVPGSRARAPLPRLGPARAGRAFLQPPRRDLRPCARSRGLSHRLRPRAARRSLR